MSDIAYQNKDITSKVFAQQFKGKSLKPYGFDLPPVKQVLPTNIPQIQANELRIDNVFLLEDDTVVIIDYESDYKKQNKHKYIRYINHVAEYYGNEWGKDISIRMIVIYTADVKQEQTSDLFDAGCIKLETESSYLSEVNSEEIAEKLAKKVRDKIPFTEEELMEFIILPLTYKGNDQKNNSIKHVIDMASHISDEETKIFILSGVAVFTDKVIRPEYADKIRRLLGMTKVGQLFEEEKIEYAKKEKVRMLCDMIDVGKLTEDDAAEMMHCSVDEFEKMRDALLQQA